jgi:hypothetical protein
LPKNINTLNREMIKGVFEVPMYYKDFSCKGKDCRDSCCKEWKVTIPFSQYILLHGLSCNKKVKEKIDRTFRIVYQPTNERYAEIVHTIDGNCPLQKEDGLCLLHETCGEEVLPWVCRYYPRGPRMNYGFEASCSNSCEKILELLFANDDYFAFETKELKFLMSKPKNDFTDEEKTNYRNIRNEVFSVLSNRSKSFSSRLLELGELLNPSIETNGYQNELWDIDLLMEFINNLKTFFDDRFPRLLNQLNQSLENFNSASNSIEFNKRLARFKDLFNNEEILFEKMIINDVYFKQFPFQTNFKPWNQYLALCASYIITKFIAINLVNEKSNLEELIDILSLSYTVISHSDFDKLISVFMNEEGYNNLSKLAKLIQF